MLCVHTQCCTIDHKLRMAYACVCAQLRGWRTAWASQTSAHTLRKSLPASASFSRSSCLRASRVSRCGLASGLRSLHAKVSLLSSRLVCLPRSTISAKHRPTCWPAGLLPTCT